MTLLRPRLSSPRCVLCHDPLSRARLALLECSACKTRAQAPRVTFAAAATSPERPAQGEPTLPSLPVLLGGTAVVCDAFSLSPTVWDLLVAGALVLAICFSAAGADHRAKTTHCLLCENVARVDRYCREHATLLQEAALRRGDVWTGGDPL